MYVSGNFCNMMKVSDCVIHELLLFKLDYYGIQGEILVWFKYFLYNRKQRVVWKSSKTQNFCSNWEIVKHDIPQVNVLCPLLLTYILCSLANQFTCWGDNACWRHQYPFLTYYIIMILWKCLTLYCYTSLNCSRLISWHKV